MKNISVMQDRVDMSEGRSSIEHAGRPVSKTHCSALSQSTRLVIFTGHPGVNLRQPAPVPAKTRTRRRGCGFFAGTGAGFHAGMRVAREPAGGWINKKYCITTVQYVQYYMAT